MEASAKRAYKFPLRWSTVVRLLLDGHKYTMSWSWQGSRLGGYTPSANDPKTILREQLCGMPGGGTSLKLQDFIGG